MPYDARMIANYFVELSNNDGEPITPMKLQKLVFFAHGWYLAIKGEPLIDDEVEAWQYGPVIPSVYDCFKGNEPITEPAEIVRRTNGKVTIETPELPSGKEHQLVRELLNKVWQVYKPYTASALSNMTHTSDAPWTKTVAPYKDKGSFPRNLEIPNDVIRNYFIDKSNQS